MRGESGLDQLGDRGAVLRHRGNPVPAARCCLTFLQAPDKISAPFVASSLADGPDKPTDPHLRRTAESALLAEPLVSAQPGILDSPQEHLDLICLTAGSRRRATLQGALQRLSEEATRLMEQHVASALTVTMGFGSAFVDTCSVTRRPKALRAMPRFKGDEFDPVQTQADLVVQVCSNVKFANHIAGKTLLGRLGGVFQPKAHHQGFIFPDTRGVLGFVDGTANPASEDRPSVVLIGDTDPFFRGGSYMAFRKIREDVAVWDKLSLRAQEDAVGRRKVDSAEYPDAPTTSHKKKSDVKVGRRDMKIYRRSYPFWSPFETGILFICYQADLDQYEAIKRSMVAGANDGHDRLEDFYHAVAGGYYFMPRRPKNRAEFVGDFLFR
jgi:porphyrinogen peroxidase